MAQTFENWLVVSDIDGTLNNKFRTLPKRNYNAIKKFTESGGNFTLASGRMVSSLKRNYDRVTPNQPAVVILTVTALMWAYFLTIMFMLLKMVYSPVGKCFLTKVITRLRILKMCPRRGG